MQMVKSQFPWTIYTATLEIPCKNHGKDYDVHVIWRFKYDIEHGAFVP